MTTFCPAWLRLLAFLFIGTVLPVCLGQAPSITTQPVNVSAVSGSNAAMMVTASGAAPLLYQWRLNGGNVRNGTNATLSITNVSITNGGAYTVVITNTSGAITSAPALFNVDEHLTFRILQLQTNGAQAIECATATGDDRGGLVVSPDYVFLTGDNSTAHFSAADLTGGTSIGRIYDSLCNNLRTEQIYVLANGTNIITSGGTINALIELDGETGLPNGRRINLSTNISMTSGVIFSGYDRIVLFDGNNNAYDIALPSGKVTPRGFVPNLQRTFSENWVSWGIAEYFTNTLQLVYVENGNFPYTNIARIRVASDSLSTPVAGFASASGGLSDMASIGFSTSRSRWYFHYEGTGQFRSGDETIGSAKALFSTNGGAPYIYQNPQPQVAYPGDTVALRVLALGNGPFSYQWRSNGVPIDAPDSATLVLSNVDFSTTANYSVDVANAAGGVSSGAALLSVIGAPQILVDPQTQSAQPGTNTSLQVVVVGAPPLSYRWVHNGVTVAGATNATYNIPLVASSDAGDYFVIVTNRYGSATSGVARLSLIVQSAFSFKVLSLSNDAVIADHENLTGGDYGGIAVSSNRVFVTGVGLTGSGGTAGFSAQDLSGGSLLADPFFALVSDLRTERVYSLGDGSNLFLTTTSIVVTTLIEINGTTGTATTNLIRLSLPIAMTNDAGLFSGYGQIVIHNGSHVYSVAVPSGVVADLGSMSNPPHQHSVGWAYWGLAENFGGSVYLAYVQTNISVVRTRVPDGLTTTIANFLNLSDMASIGASVSRGRWYFHYAGASQFGGSNETVGFCSAAFSITANPVVDHFVWEPLPGAQFSGVPFTATITARSIDNTVLSNFSGTVSLAGFATADGAPVTVVPSSSGNFSNGVWMGQLTVPEPTPGLVIRAADIAGHFGLSSPFVAGTTNDVGVQLIPSTNAATIYAAFTYHAIVRNSGPEVSLAVFATNILPANIDFISVVSSQGSCALVGNTVVCDIGTMNSGTSVSIDIVVVPNALGTLTNSIRVARSAAETHPENNLALSIIPVSSPVITFSDASVPEGDFPTARSTNIFTVQLNTTSAVPVSVQFTTAPGTATNTGDYVTRSGLLIFQPGQTTTNIRVTIGSDQVYETDEYFFVNFFNATNATLIRTQAIGMIVNDDPQPTLVVSDVAVAEGNSGTPLISFAARLSAPAGVPISISYATSNGTAVVGSDYLPANGLLYYSNGATNLFISLNIVGDTLGESNEFFYVRFFNGTNINVNTQIVVTILNDDPANVLHHFVWSSVAPTQELNTPFPATVSARDVTDRPLTNYNGSVRLSSGASDLRDHLLGDVVPVNNFTGSLYTIGFAFTPSSDIYMTHVRHISGTKVSIWTDSGTLVAARSVNSVNGVWVETEFPTPVKLAAGTTYRIAGFNGGLTNPWYYGNTLPATFKNGTVGHGLYAPGDAFPTIDLGSSAYLVDMSYVLSLVTFSMTPTNATFTNGNWGGSVRILTPGTNFHVFATDTNAQVSSASGVFDVLLVDDIALQISPSASPTPTAETLIYSVTVSNAGPTTSTGVLLTNRLPANATYVSSSIDHGSLTLNGGTVVGNIGTLASGDVASLVIAVRPNGNGNLTNTAVVRRNEAEAYLSNNSLTNIVAAVGLALTVADTSIVEGHSGANNMVFNVSLTAASTQIVSVAYGAQNSTATAGSDYQSVNGLLVFAPGVTNLSVAVPVFGDVLNESNERFFLSLNNATNASIVRSLGIGTIVDDDPLPMISVSDIAVAEGRTGFTPVTFTLTLSPASGRTVTVNASTLDGTASSADYVPTNATLIFAPGQTSLPMTVMVRADSALEPDEFFLLRLSGATNATLAVAEARATILNDDNGGGTLDHFDWSLVPSPQTINRDFNVTITARDGVNALMPFNGTLAFKAFTGTNTVPLAPTNSTAFVNGIWSGTLTLLNTASNVVLAADDGAGHNGTSNPFDVNIADLALSVSAPPQVLIASPFTYTITVTNLGPGAATAVTVTNRLSVDAVFVNGNASGGCVVAGGVVTCSAGVLSNGGMAIVTITVEASRGGTLSNSFFVTAFEFDPVPTNNLQSISTVVTGDEDRDGLPDAWEIDHGLSPSNPNDANIDSDGDHHTNLQEYIAGTDPMNPASVLKVAASVKTGSAQVRFTTVANKHYVVERAPAPNGPWSAVGDEIIGDGDVVIFFDPDPVNDVQRFYRVRVNR
jgi:uncharacterized repeat protein (TIGR01451 family)